MIGQSRFDERVLKILRPTDYLSRSYSDGSGNRVGFYLGYHAGGPGSGPIHSPKHCLPGSGWHEVSERTVSLPVGETVMKLVRSVYQNGEAKEMFLYWFQVQESTLDNEYALKLAEVANSIFRNRRDAAFIRISIPFEADEEKAFETGKRFIETFQPAIAMVLPR
jgi:EpsI family protein